MQQHFRIFVFLQKRWWQFLKFDFFTLLLTTYVTCPFFQLKNYNVLLTPAWLALDPVELFWGPHSLYSAAWRRFFPWLILDAASCHSFCFLDRAFIFPILLLISLIIFVFDISSEYFYLFNLQRQFFPFFFSFK